MNILFIDYFWHRTTKSADFFLNLLKHEFNVYVHYYEAQHKPNIPIERIQWADIVIVWQATLGRRDIVIPGKRCIYIPMYDCDWGSFAQWKRIARSGIQIISFSNAITKFANNGNVPKSNILELRYAYNPDDFINCQGDPSVAALWDRGAFSIATIKKLFTPGFFQKLIIFRRPQPGLIYDPISAKDIAEYNIEVKESDYLPKDEYINLLKKPGVYIAPRPKEGIGMSFLEQLAMGKCVIAHDDNTMNEYIKDGKNGIIRNFYNPTRPITKDDITKAYSGAKKSAQEMYAKWLEDREKIIPFIKATMQKQAVEIGGVKDISLRILYAFEAALSRL